MANKITIWEQTKEWIKSESNVHSVDYFFYCVLIWWSIYFDVSTSIPRCMWMIRCTHTQRCSNWRKRYTTRQLNAFNVDFIENRWFSIGMGAQLLCEEKKIRWFESLQCLLMMVKWHKSHCKVCINTKLNVIFDALSSNIRCPCIGTDIVTHTIAHSKQVLQPNA